MSYGSDDDFTINGGNPPINIPPSLIPTPPAIVQKIEPVKYKVKENDSLTKIAKENDTTVERLWQKNTQLTNPDLLEIGQELTIPFKDEVLPERPNTPPTPKVGSQPTGNSSGNAYEPGQCVWALKEWRPELPNNWGSAVSWLRNAQSQGWPTGSEPRVGAVGWTSGHVVLITAVNPDGTVDIKDMNGRWIPFEVGYGRYSASKYLYIY